MSAQIVQVGPVALGADRPLTLIAGPCVIESRNLLNQVAAELVALTQRLGIGLIFKSSFDKANRSALSSFRGPGFEAGLTMLADLKREFQIPVVSDVHETWQVEPAAQVLDLIQIPAFLARQTDLLLAAAESGRPVEVKKGQFLAPEDMARVAEKMASRPNFAGLILVERGACFGYHNLVVDMRSLVIMREIGWPVVFDATHSVQLPSAAGLCSGGERRFIPALARAAVGVGVAGLFLETHPEPAKALCDGPNQWPLGELAKLLTFLVALDRLVKESRAQGALEGDW
ncbi:MAG: 3-deoxy-8-phosphooctulonate synthase [Deltaproteobacteria bacterium]|jgi:2-dehydro-3-deoxyphosphooctonate aldolase (KDO 8-P synthase)|nr:3-deoxy-8-phosphooctulonate synthase [Deltaproteobacteria bacterium]